MSHEHEHDQDDQDDPDDPRPVFEGDWQSASGVEKGRHSERVRQWRKRQGVEGLSRRAEPSDPRARRPYDPQAAVHAEDLATLDAIIAAPKALASDKIRAVEAKQRILARREAEERESEHGPLVALRDAIALLPSDQRVDALGSLMGVAPLA